MIRYFKISKSRLGVIQLTAALFRKEGRPMLVHLLRQLYLLGGRPNRNWVTIVHNYLRFINKLHKHQGLPGVVKYLKVSGVYIQQVIAGHRLPDAASLGPKVRRCKTGLPSFIPIPHRINIRSGDPVVIRFWTTMCSIYRDIKYEGIVKFSSIINSSDNIVPNYDKESRRFMNLFMKQHDSILKESIPFPILTSAPTVKGTSEFSSSFRSLLRGVSAFLEPKNTSLYASLRYVLNFNKSQSLLDLFQKTEVYLSEHVREDRMTGYCSSYLGKLAIKEEAAGKMRVFAMVDPWTQWALRPLHKWLFTILRSHPMDGTFNQLAPLSRVPFGDVPIYSYDLTAATDRLPIAIQKNLLSVVFGRKFSEAWATLLVDRDYQISHLQKQYPYITLPGGIGHVRYAVGQPMGAYSSWAMLALTHHFIVQMAAWSTNVTSHSTLFRDYAVLGDDIVLWNKLVAEKYHEIMTSLGVEIGIAKSVISPKGLGLEFAKRTLFKGTDVSPAPLKEAVAAHTSTSQALELLRKYRLNGTRWLRFLGYGYQVSLNKNSKQMKVIRTVMTLPRDIDGLQRLFSFVGGFLDPSPRIRVHLHRIVIKLIMKESSNLERQIADAYWGLVQWDASKYLTTFPLYVGKQAALENRIQLDSLGDYVRKTLSELWSLISLLRLIREDLGVHNYHVSMPYWDLPPFEHPRTFSDIRVVRSIRTLFRVQNEWSNINLDSIMKPVRSVPDGQLFTDLKENTPTIRRWNRWLKVLSHKDNIVQSRDLLRI